MNGNAKPGEVAAAAHAADDHVGKVPGQLQLLLRLQADDRLVQHDVVQHAAERVLGVVAGDGRLDRLADGDAQAAGAIRDPAARICRPALVSSEGLGVDLGAPDVHHRAAVGLLLVADLDHEDLALHVEQRAGEGQRGAPLAGPGLGGQAVDAFHLVVVRLGHGRVRLVAARRAVAFVLEVDPGRRLQRLFQVRRPHQRRRPPDRRSTSRTSSGISIHRSWLTSCSISSSAKIGSRSCGPSGCFVPGCSGGGTGSGRSA